MDLSGGYGNGVLRSRVQFGAGSWSFLVNCTRWWARMNPRLHLGVVVFLLFLLLFELAVYLIPLPRAALQPPTSTLVFDREGRVLRAFTSADGRWRIRTGLDQVSPLLQKYLVFYEDRWFYYHPGVNPVALIRALGRTCAPDGSSPAGPR